MASLDHNELKIFQYTNETQIIIIDQFLVTNDDFLPLQVMKPQQAVATRNGDNIPHHCGYYTGYAY